MSPGSRLQQPPKRRVQLNYLLLVGRIPLCAGALGTEGPEVPARSVSLLPERIVPGSKGLQFRIRNRTCFAVDAQCRVAGTPLRRGPLRRSPPFAGSLLTHGHGYRPAPLPDRKGTVPERLPRLARGFPRARTVAEIAATPHLLPTPAGFSAQLPAGIISLVATTCRARCVPPLAAPHSAAPASSGNKPLPFPVPKLCLKQCGRIPEAARHSEAISAQGALKRRRRAIDKTKDTLRSAAARAGGLSFLCHGDRRTGARKDGNQHCASDR